MATRFSIEDVAGAVGVGTADLKQSTINAINIALGLAALVAVFFIIAGGADWLISGKSDEVVKVRAQRLFWGGLIGLIVVLLSWAIVTFTIGTTVNVTA